MLEASHDNAEDSRLVSSSKPKPKSKAAPPATQPSAAAADPELGDDGFPRDDVPDLTSGLAPPSSAADHTAITVASDGGDDLEAQEHAVRKAQIGGGGGGSGIGAGGAGDKTEALLRRGFLRKVYGLLTAQMTLTVLVCAFITLSDPLRAFVITHALGVQLLCVVPLIALIIALYYYKNEYPRNLQLLAAFSIVEAINLGTLCAVMYEAGAGKAILLAALLTAIAFVGLTLFTLQSAIDFSFLGAGLFALLFVLCIGSLVSMAFGLNANLPLALLGTAVFCLYIVYDTYMISQRYGVDEYIPATIDLYLDLINLFIYILRLIVSLSKRD